MCGKRINSLMLHRDCFCGGATPSNEWLTSAMEMKGILGKGGRCRCIMVLRNLAYLPYLRPLVHKPSTQLVLRMPSRCRSPVDMLPRMIGPGNQHADLLVPFHLSSEGKQEMLQTSLNPLRCSCTTYTITANMSCVHEWVR